MKRAARSLAASLILAMTAIARGLPPGVLLLSLRKRRQARSGRGFPHRPENKPSETLTESLRGLKQEQIQTERHSHCFRRA